MVLFDKIGLILFHFAWRRYYKGQPDIYWVSTEKIDSLKLKLVGIRRKNQVTPQLLYLFHNYPNPFNTSTIIRLYFAQPQLK